MTFIPYTAQTFPAEVKKNTILTTKDLGHTKNYIYFSEICILLRDLRALRGLALSLSSESRSIYF